MNSRRFQLPLHRADLPAGGQTLSPTPKTRFFSVATVVLIVGYLSASRTFAYIGHSPLFVGEAVLAVFLASCPLLVATSWLDPMRRPAPSSALMWALFLSTVYGFLQLVRGLAADHPTDAALKTVVFHVYPLYLFLGTWIGRIDRRLLSRTLRVWLPWLHGLYGCVYVILLQRFVGMQRLESGVDAPEVFGQPIGAIVCILGLICFEPSAGRAAIPLVLNGIVLLGGMGRSHFLALAAGLAFFGVLTGRLGTVLKVGGILTWLLALGLITDFSVSLGNPDEGAMCARTIVAKTVAAVDSELAAWIAPETAAFYADTASWRTSWWKEILADLHQSAQRAVVGPGFGYPIWRLHPLDLGERQVRTPHNVLIFALAYTGWIGLGIFCAWQAALAWASWKVFRRTGQPFGACLWLMIMIHAFFDNYFETPYGAIPFYLLLGLALSPLQASPGREDADHGNRR